jgi:glutamate-5-semialdehyde dehydrogenase
MLDLKQMGANGKKASRLMAKASTTQKNQALKNLAEGLEKQQKEILSINRQDIAAAAETGLNEAMIDRLSLQGRLEGIANDVRDVIALPDPVGEIFEKQVLPNGLSLCKMRTPIGVLGVIYEARPNVTIDVAALTIKTGNCAILRGGSETIRSNSILIKVIREALSTAGLPSDAVQFVESTDRKLVYTLLRMHEFVDLIIPRGGASLHQFCLENSSIPVITGGIGICHLFVDESADLEKTLMVIHNAKTQRPTVCNALDTLLVHTKIASQFIPKVIENLAKSGVAFRLDPKAMQLYKQEQQGDVKPASSDDWNTEWLSLILGIKVVDSIDEAIAHVQQYSTGHSDGILTENTVHADRFVEEIDSAAVYVNASTRFTDGGQFGLGAEVAISTQKLHARGPMGLQELTSYKWVARGNYHVRK